MPTTALRLISPTFRRIYPNARTGTGMKTAGPLVREQRAGYEEGQADPVTIQCLIELDWKPYDGPALTDERGYIIRGTDPKLIS